MEYAVFAKMRNVKEYASGYMQVYGTGCYTKEAMDDYCSSLDPDGKVLKVMPLPFDVNDPANLDYVIEEPNSDWALK